MIIVMQSRVDEAVVQEMVRHVESLGMKPHVLYGVERTVIAAIGPEREGLKEAFEQGPGVAEVLPILAPYKIASREVKKETSVVTAGSLTIGGVNIGVIAGPLSLVKNTNVFRVSSRSPNARMSRPTASSICVMLPLKWL